MSDALFEMPPAANGAKLLDAMRAVGTAFSQRFDLPLMMATIVPDGEDARVYSMIPTGSGLGEVAGAAGSMMSCKLREVGDAPNACPHCTEWRRRLEVALAVLQAPLDAEHRH